MKKILIILILTITGLCSCGQTGESLPDKGTIAPEPVDSTKEGEKDMPLAEYPYTYIYSEYKYPDSTGKAIIIKNSLPKGGVRYTAPDGTEYAYLVYWSRVINKTAVPLELTMNFPADFPSPYSYLKLFLPPDTMTLDKASSYSYGLTDIDIESFLATTFNKPTHLQRTIHPKEECLFYILVLSSKLGGAVRTELLLQEDALFYNIKNIAPELDAALIPCGQLVFKK